MKKETSFSPKRIEEAARAHDVLSRARAAAPVSGPAGRDVLLGHGLGSLNLRSSDD